VTASLGPTLTTSPVLSSTPPPGPIDFPLGWILQRAAPPIQYRASTEIARLSGHDRARLALLPYAYRPALKLAFMQGPDGVWSNAMLTVPSVRADQFEGVGTISAVRRLVEYGWDRESPPLTHARRILFRLLAEDEDAAFLFEFGGKGTTEPDAVRRGRTILREAAAAALAQAGYENDPRLRGAARRILARMHNFLRSPLAQRPFVRVGNQQVLSPEAAPPSIFTIVMLAFMPLFRSEHFEVADRLYQYLAQPLPRQTAAVLVGKRIVSQPHLVLGDPLPTRNAADADVPWALTWLELMARLQFLRRNDGWSRLFERFLDDRDQDGIWHPHKGMAIPRTSNPHVWPSFPLESHLSGEERWSDVTFRLGLIARLSGRGINVV
jgi:hypothetical protein